MFLNSWNGKDFKKWHLVSGEGELFQSVYFFFYFFKELV